MTNVCKNIIDLIKPLGQALRNKRKPIVFQAALDRFQQEADAFCLGMDLAQDQNDRGNAGEHFFEMLMALNHVQTRFLGEKAKFKDFQVDFEVLENGINNIYTASVQVKAPLRVVYSFNGDSIRVTNLDKKHVQGLVHQSTATYVVIVDEDRQICYVVGIFSGSHAIRWIPTKYQLLNPLLYPNGKTINERTIYRWAYDVALYCKNYTIDTKTSYNSALK